MSDIYKGSMGTCHACKATNVEVCRNGNYCRECHVSCSWEDCMDQMFEARMLATYAPRAYVQKIYPTARTDEVFCTTTHEIDATLANTVAVKVKNEK